MSPQSHCKQEEVDLIIMTLPRSSSSTSQSRQLASRSKRMPLGLVAFLAINFVYMAKLHNEASRNLDSHLNNLAHSHLPPSHNGQSKNEKETKNMFDWDLPTKVREGRELLLHNVVNELCSLLICIFIILSSNSALLFLSLQFYILFSI